MLPCPKCSYSNELGRIFCHQCGAKLDLSQIKAPSQGGKSLKKKRKSQTWKVVRLLLELTLFALVAFAIYLAWQTPTKPTDPPSTQSLLGADEKRIKLERLVAGTKSGKVEVTPSEVNAFLNGLTMEKPPEAWLVFAPQAVRMEFVEGAVKVKLWGELSVGKEIRKLVYCSYTCVPVTENGSFTVRATAGTVGYLPIHPWVMRTTGLVERFVAGAFAKMEQEQKALAKVTTIMVRPERATLEFHPKAVAPPAP